MSIGACGVCRCVACCVYGFVCVCVCVLLKIIIAQQSKDGWIQKTFMMHNVGIQVQFYFPVIRGEPSLIDPCV